MTGSAPRQTSLQHLHPMPFELSFAAATGGLSRLWPACKASSRAPLPYQPLSRSRDCPRHRPARKRSSITTCCSSGGLSPDPMLTRAVAASFCRGYAGSSSTSVLVSAVRPIVGTLPQIPFRRSAISRAAGNYRSPAPRVPQLDRDFRPRLVRPRVNSACIINILPLHRLVAAYRPVSHALICFYAIETTLLPDLYFLGLFTLAPRLCPAIFPTLL